MAKKQSTKTATTIKSPLKKFEFPQSIRNLSLSNQPSYLRTEPTTLLEGQIVTIDRFFSSAICDDLIKTVLSPNIGIQLETTPLIKSKEYAARVNDRCAVVDNQIAETLWDYLYGSLIEKDQIEEDDQRDWINEEFGSGIGLNPQLRMYRYRSGQYFEKHYDESVTVKVGGKDGKIGKTKWTLLIYLTGGKEFEGGGTIFYNVNNNKKNVLNVHPSKGMALLHKHGDDCLLHEAEAVSSGEKWVLRSDVVFLQ